VPASNRRRSRSSSADRSAADTLRADQPSRSPSSSWVIPACLRQYRTFIATTWSMVTFTMAALPPASSVSA
jgi:hypothetical protein